MKKCDNSKIHISNNSLLSICLLIMLRHLITKTNTTLQHFVTLHHTSPNYTSLHFTKFGRSVLGYVIITKASHRKLR